MGTVYTYVCMQTGVPARLYPNLMPQIRWDRPQGLGP